MSITEVLFEKSALEVFDSEIRKYGFVETGGILLGRIDENRIVVQKASECGPKAVHEDLYFRADANFINMTIDMEYANSDGKVCYLGEWHTHPQVYPEPSKVDLNSLAEIVDSSGEPNLLLIIGAVGFKASVFFKQSISILKYPESDKFILLKPQVK